MHSCTAIYYRAGHIFSTVLYVAASPLSVRSPFGIPRPRRSPRLPCSAAPCSVRPVPFRSVSLLPHHPRRSRPPHSAVPCPFPSAPPTLLVPPQPHPATAQLALMAISRHTTPRPVPPAACASLESRLSRRALLSRDNVIRDDVRALPDERHQDLSNATRKGRNQ